MGYKHRKSRDEAMAKIAPKKDTPNGAPEEKVEIKLPPIVGEVVKGIKISYGTPPAEKKTTAKPKNPKNPKKE